jgi:hypothetical protein
LNHSNRNQEAVAQRLNQVVGGPAKPWGVVLMALVVIFVLSGCGADGADGKASIAYTWLYGPIVFDTNDPAFQGQEYIYNGEFKETRSGS